MKYYFFYIILEFFLIFNGSNRISSQKSKIFRISGTPNIRMSANQIKSDNCLFGLNGSDHEYPQESGYPIRAHPYVLV